MWILYAFGSAFFAGLTAILAKLGLQKIDSTVATGIRTIIILFFLWGIVYAIGSHKTLSDISTETFLFLALSGFSTGASWLCYFKALQTGDVNKVVPIDRSSLILTVLLATFFFGERITFGTLFCLIGMGIGTYLMLERKPSTENFSTHKKSWFFYAILSAVFASLTALLGKLGIDGVESNLGTAIRTIIVLFMAFLLIFIQKKQNDIKNLDLKSFFFLVASGITTGLSWLCYFKALKDGVVSIVVPIDKLSIVVSVLFSSLILKEEITKKSLLGLFLIVLGTIGMIL